jgi:hypothetical protein
MATRITWSKSEREALYSRMVEIAVEGRYTDARNVLRFAQEALPADRRRKVTDGMVFNYKAMLAQAKSEAHTRLRDRKLTEVALQQPAAPAPVELGLGELFEKLVAEVTRRVTAEVRAALDAEKPSVIVEHGYANSRPAGNARERLAMIDTPSQRVRKPVVLIIGLNGQQITSVKHTYKDLDVICVSPEDALSRNPIRADFTILMTKFINHSAQNKYRQVPNLKYCNGGVSELATVMYAIRQEAA